jgi:AICAR transformylase/IMP cyclohydrolase PurH
MERFSESGSWRYFENPLRNYSNILGGVLITENDKKQGRREGTEFAVLSAIQRKNFNKNKDYSQTIQKFFKRENSKDKGYFVMSKMWRKSSCRFGFSPHNSF